MNFLHLSLLTFLIINIVAVYAVPVDESILHQDVQGSNSEYIHPTDNQEIFLKLKLLKKILFLG
uniref:Uncharacterized protein n=2 Tax=Glossina TaxID=44049 RepID=A0A1A9VN17_GLOAU